MAYQHISIQQGSPLGGQLYNAISQLESSKAKLNELVNAMPYMVDGSDYSHLEVQFGFETGKGETAKAELESMLAKINTDDSVTNVNAAMLQVFNFFA